MNIHELFANNRAKIFSTNIPKEEVEEKKGDLDTIKGVGPDTIKKLNSEGIFSIDDLKTIGKDAFMKIQKINPITKKQIIKIYD